MMLGFISLFAGIIMCALWLGLLLDGEPSWGWALAIDILLFIIAYIDLAPYVKIC